VGGFEVGGGWSAGSRGETRAEVGLGVSAALRGAGLVRLKCGVRDTSRAVTRLLQTRRSANNDCFVCADARYIQDHAF
jgi:hypothetical protein